MLKAVSLFSGAGGMDVGARLAGIEVVAASELDPHASRTFRKNHPRTRLFEGDILEHMAELGRLRGIDIVFGGPPCQGFSVAGKMNPEDPRSRLVFSFCDVVERLRPRAFVMENVKALGTLEKFARVRESILQRMTALGYRVTMNILNARDFGVPQSRERVFFIGIKGVNSAIDSEDFVAFHRPTVTVREAIAALGRPGSPDNPGITRAKIVLARKPVLRKSPYAGMLFNGQGRPLNPDTCASTLPASMGGNRTPIIDERQLYAHKPAWVETYHWALSEGLARVDRQTVPPWLRRLTVTEAACLQSFPRDYVFEGPQSRVFSQIGNAVPCQLAEGVMGAVVSALAGREKVPPVI